MAFSSGSKIGHRDLRTAVVEVLRKVRLREAVVNTTMEFFRNTSLHGFRDLADRKVHWLDRLILSACLVAFTAWSLHLVLVAWAAFTLNPIYVRLDADDHPVADVPFPGIAICSNNKLSKTATWNYAQFLSNKTRGSVTEDVFAEQLRYLGRLLDYEVDGYDNFNWLQNYLNEFDSPSIWYDTYTRMRELSPQCDDMLLYCMWEGVERNCKDLFKLRTTQDGFCCTFNYVRADNQFPDLDEEPVKTHLHGVDSGLHVILNSSDADYYYPLLSHYGHSVHLFDPHDYPDMATGYLQQRFIKPNVETMVELFASTVVATESLRLFSPSQRNCLFQDERPGFNGHYSQSDCLLNCRIRSLDALCDCVPFFIPRTSDNPYLANSTQTCNLEHVACLNKYLTKMRTYYPTSGNISGLEKELQDSIDCGECLPPCNNVYYNVGTVSIALHAEAIEELWEQKLGGRNERTPVAVVKIYHARRRSLLYVQDVVSEWFNMLSMFVGDINYTATSYYGGQVGLCIGFSLLSFLELAYFCTWRLWREIENLYRQRNDKGRKTRRIKPFQAIELNARPVYNTHTDRYFLR